MVLRDLRVSSLLVLSLALVACADEPTEFTGSSTTGTTVPTGATTTSSGTGSGAGDGGGSSSGGDGGDGTTESGPTTSNGDTSGSDADTGPGPGGGAPNTADFDLTLDDSGPDLNLRESVDLTVTIAENGYVGTVFLDVSGLPSDVFAQLGDESVTLDGNGTTTVTLTLETSTGTVSGQHDFTVTATAEEGMSDVLGALTVHPELLITIPSNLASYEGSQDAFGPFPTVIAQPPGGISADNPVVIRFYNDDTVDHEIHADNPDEGFGHGQGPIGPGEMDPVVRSINTPGTYNYYPHDLGTGIPGRIVIE